MLNFTRDRIDYGQHLQPPPGKTFHCGIATTYSLDLHALIATSMALSLDQTLEGDLAGEKIALLESLDRLSSSLTVFYQRGNIKVPREFSRLFTLLEPMLCPITPGSSGANDAFTSFHPKLWLLRFHDPVDVKSVAYRLVVLTRNLTFDRSWDLAASIDGSPNDEKGVPDKNLAIFVASLVPHAKQREHLDLMAEELRTVKWRSPAPFGELRMLPGGGAHIANSEKRFGMPLQLGRSSGDVLVLSPFVDADDHSVLKTLESIGSGTRTLISRADTLDRIGAKALSGWDCLALNRKVVEGEERLERPGALRQDLHAKLIVTTSGQRTHWHIGSANATNAAFGKPGQTRYPPRNSEFMLRLSGSTAEVGPARLLRDWKDRNVPVFVPHIFVAFTQTDAQLHEQALRKLTHAVIAANWKAEAIENGSGTFSLLVRHGRQIRVPEGFAIEVAPMCQPQARQSLSDELTWPSLGLTDLSAFLPVFITGPVKGVSAKLVIQAKLKLDRKFDRTQAVFRSLVDSKQKLLQFIGLMLEPLATKEQWLGLDRRAGSNPPDIFGQGNLDELFERLMKSAARSPHRLDRVLSVVTRMKRQGIDIPPGLDDLLRTFKAYKDAHS